MIQHIASSANPVGVGISGDNFKIPIDNPVGSGNCLVLCMTYPHGVSPTITDNNGNTWPSSPSVTADGGVNNYISSIFVLPNARSGQTTITVAFGTVNATVIPFQYDLTEFNNISLSSPVNGTSSTALTTSSSNTLSAGTFTPTTNNDANGGNVILSYHCIGASAAGNPTTWSAGSGFTLLEGDITWTSGQGVPHAMQWQIQTTQSSVSCSIGETGDTLSSYNSVALALKIASAGTSLPAGIRIRKVLHFTNQATPASLTIQTPTIGNLMVITTTDPDVTTVSDSDGGTWTFNNTTGGACLGYSQNRTANQNRKMTFSISASRPASWRIYDISSAAVSAFDTLATTASTALNAATVFNNAPTITPSVSGCLVIAAIQLGQGPGLSMSSPTGSVFELCLHDVSSGVNPDNDLMENADGNAYLYNAPASALNFNWNITNQATNSGTAIAASFHA